jgi:hypothetical protein
MMIVGVLTISFSWRISDTTLSVGWLTHVYSAENSEPLTAETEWLTQNWLRRQGVQNDRFDYFDLNGE